MNRKLTSLALGASSFALAVAAYAPAASAQSLQYGSMEEIFGEPVTEGATGTPKRASDAPVNMTIITSDEIRRSGSRDIMEVLRRHVGIDVQRGSQNSGNVSVRGLNIDGGRLRVLINGRDTFRSYEGTTQWASLPVALAEIRQIEVVRGPATALYGANAVIGVVNIITFSPLYDDASNVTARVGDNGVKEVVGNATVKLNDKVGVRLSGGYFEANRFDAPLTANEALVRLKPESHWFSADSLFQVSDRVQVGLELTHFNGNVHAFPATGSMNNSKAEDYSVKGTIIAETGMGRWTGTALLNSNEETRLTALNIPGGTLLLEQSIEAETKLLDVTNIQTVGSNTGLRVSAGYRSDKVGQFGGSIADGTGDVGYDTYYASFLVDQPLGDTFTLDISGRYDYIDTYRSADELPYLSFDNDDYGSYDAISANVGLTWKVSEVDTLKFMYARGFLAPTTFALGGQIVPNNAFPGITAFGGSPNARPSISTQYEVQYQRSLDSIGADFSVAAYHRKDADIYRSVVFGGLYPVPGFGYYVGTAVIGDAGTWGLELDLSGKTEDGFHWALRYGLADTTQNLDFVGGVGPASGVYPLVPEDFVGRSPKHILTANVGYEKATGLYTDLLVQYKSDYDNFAGFVLPPAAPNPYRNVGSVWIANANVGYKFDSGIRLFVTGEGLFNEHRYEHVAAQARVDRRIWAGIAFDF